MDGNLAMANYYLFETEEQHNFLADVYHYMQENDCDQESAFKAVEPLYR